MRIALDAFYVPRITEALCPSPAIFLPHSPLTQVALGPLLRRHYFDIFHPPFARTLELE